MSHRSFSAISRRNFTLSLLGLGFAAGCNSEVPTWSAVTGNAPAQAASNADPSEYVVFFDRSTSISQASKTLWLERDFEQLLKGLGAGDRLALYGVDDRTGTAPPLFEAELPLLEGDGMDEQVRYQGQRKRMLTGAREKAREFLAGPVATETDIFGAFGRIPHEGKRSRVIVFFSDMRPSTPDFDMERVTLSPALADSSFKAAARRFRWSRDLLHNAEVRCHLDVPAEPEPATPAVMGKQPASNLHAPKRPRAPVNDRQELESYWTGFVRSLGGSLTHFDNAEFRPAEPPGERAPNGTPDPGLPGSEKLKVQPRPAPHGTFADMFGWLRGL